VFSYNPYSNILRFLIRDNIRIFYEFRRFSIKKRYFLYTQNNEYMKTKSGDWIVIELNDGQQSGLSYIEPELFYQELSKCLK